MIIIDEIIEPYNKETNFNENKTTCKTKNFHILLEFLLITIKHIYLVYTASLIAVGILKI